MELTVKTTLSGVVELVSGYILLVPESLLRYIPPMFVSKRALVSVARNFLPPSLKDFMFRFSFAIMKPEQQFLFQTRYHMASMQWSLQNLKKLGFNPEYILDIGAYEGEWTREVASIFPEAKFLMLEAQEGKAGILSGIAGASSGRVDYEIALLGASEKVGVEFNEMETGSSVLYEQTDAGRTKTIRAMTTLDNVVHKRKIKRTEFIKLDVQGYELEILKGAADILRTTEVIYMEVSLLPIIRGAPLLDEVLPFMRENGFVAYDICSLIRRKRSGSLWQIDVLFVRQTSPLLASQTWQ